MRKNITRIEKLLYIYVIYNPFPTLIMQPNVWNNISPDAGIIMLV